MKLSLISILALSFMLPVAAAAEAWAPGVSRHGGWVDYDKDAVNKPYMDDEGMCWAAAASNVITWWQNHNAELLTSTTLPTHNAWDVYRLVYLNIGGVPANAFNWYINGISTDQYGVPQYGFGSVMDAEVYDNTKEEYNNIQWYFDGGFLSDIYSTAENPITLAVGNSDSYAMCRRIVDALESGYALVLSASAHALTLWGVEYEETDKGIVITKAWVTDSDDYQNALIESSEFSVKSSEDGNAVAMKLPTYGDGTSFVYSAVSGMRTAPSTPMIPEPTTATLSLLALAGLAARRRRK